MKIIHSCLWISFASLWTSHARICHWNCFWSSKPCSGKPRFLKVARAGDLLLERTFRASSSFVGYYIPLERPLGHSSKPFACCRYARAWISTNQYFFQVCRSLERRKSRASVPSHFSCPLERGSLRSSEDLIFRKFYQVFQGMFWHPHCILGIPKP